MDASNDIQNDSITNEKFVQFVDQPSEDQSNQEDNEETSFQVDAQNIVRTEDYSFLKMKPTTTNPCAKIILKTMGSIFSARNMQMLYHGLLGSHFLCFL